MRVDKMPYVWSAVVASLFTEVSLASQWSARYSGYNTFPENESKSILSHTYKRYLIITLVLVYC